MVNGLLRNLDVFKFGEALFACVGVRLENVGAGVKADDVQVAFSAHNFVQVDFSHHNPLRAVVRARQQIAEGRDGRCVESRSICLCRVLTASIVVSVRSNGVQSGYVIS